MFDLTFHHPFSMIVCGSSQSGKTTFCKRLIEHKRKLIKDAPAKVFLFYQEHQKLYDRMVRKKILTKAIRGIPEHAELKMMAKEVLETDPRGCIFILDDALSILDGHAMELLFAQTVHHQKVSVLLVTQSLFYKSKSMRTLSLNAQYLVIFKNVRDLRQIKTLGSQIGLHSASFFVQSFQKAT